MAVAIIFYDQAQQATKFKTKHEFLFILFDSLYAKRGRRRRDDHIVINVFNDVAATSTVPPKVIKDPGLVMETR